MSKPCSICVHPRLRDITTDMMRRVPYRTLGTRYGLSKSAIHRHLQGHVSTALRRLEVEMIRSVDVGGPVIEQMRGLNQRAMRILADAEAAEDRSIALQAIRECRRNLELIAKLTGELDPRAAGETPGAVLHVTVNYVDKAVMTGAEPSPLPEARRLTDGPPDTDAATTADVL